MTLAVTMLDRKHDSSSRRALPVQLSPTHCAGDSSPSISCPPVAIVPPTFLFYSSKSPGDSGNPNFPDSITMLVNSLMQRRLIVHRPLEKQYMWFRLVDLVVLPAQTLIVTISTRQ